MKEFTSILNKIEHEWKRNHYKLDVLPSIGIHTINQFKIHQKIDELLISNFHHQLTKYDTHPALGVIKIAQTPLLAMYLHIWDRDIGTPHHHVWSGFFMNLKGTIIHSIYNFEEEESFGANLKFGTLSTKKREILLQGDAVPVFPGKAYIHGLWHIDHPCVSLSVRTNNKEKFPYDEITTDYNKMSGIAYSNFSTRKDTPQLVKWLGLQRTLKNEKKYFSIINDFIENEDPSTVLSLIQKLIRIHNNFDIIEHIKNEKYSIDKRILEKYILFSEGVARDELFKDIRLNIEDFELRVLFGVLYTTESIHEFCTLIQTIFPNEDGIEKSVKLLYKAILTPEVEASSASFKKAIQKYFERILSTEKHDNITQNILSSDDLNSEEKNQFMNTVSSLRDSIVFKPLFV
ncbi:hypothetical protein KORDIASMS9_04251 [Kordia sp. SMS9]|uniref:hypothetical protein n=1 Tax=Kordia sp. SMS9 TaxID=2282170 RepID=UPI000E0D2DDD|nr:hypothetical protein [Kordia sp. SMS9]AXG71990.1 hypothetical protein KORDIASMS9_04251 [Kordia sp. SMS9]